MVRWLWHLDSRLRQCVRCGGSLGPLWPVRPHSSPWHFTFKLIVDTFDFYFCKDLLPKSVPLIGLALYIFWNLIHEKHVSVDGILSFWIRLARIWKLPFTYFPRAHVEGMLSRDRQPEPSLCCRRMCPFLRLHHPSVYKMETRKIQNVFTREGREALHMKEHRLLQPYQLVCQKENHRHILERVMCIFTAGIQLKEIIATETATSITN